LATIDIEAGEDQEEGVEDIIAMRGDHRTQHQEEQIQRVQQVDLHQHRTISITIVEDIQITLLIIILLDMIRMEFLLIMHDLVHQDTIILRHRQVGLEVQVIIRVLRIDIIEVLDLHHLGQCHTIVAVTVEVPLGIIEIVEQLIHLLFLDKLISCNGREESSQRETY